MANRSQYEPQSRAVISILGQINTGNDWKRPKVSLFKDSNII